MTDGPQSPLPPPDPDAIEQEWYADGLCFQCTGCGNCCTGPPGNVWFTEDEGRAIAASLGLEEKKFLRRFARRVGRRWSLTERKTEHGYDCIFLDRETAPGSTRCRIYDVRPTQCRTWPFWRENLDSPDTWASAKADTPCPGMDTGPLVPVEKIRIQRDAVD